MADFYAAIIQSTAPTSDGLYQYKTPNLGGKTPKVAIGMMSDGGTLGTTNADWRQGFGFTDGVNQSASVLEARDSESSTRVGRVYDDTAFLRRDTANETGAFSQWLSDTGDGETGIEVNWSNTPSYSKIFTIILFAGDDLSAASDTVTVPSSSLDVTGPGFQPDMVLFHTTCRSVGSETDIFMGSFGVAYDNGTSIANWLIGQQEDANASSSAMKMKLSTEGVAEQKGNWVVSAGDFDSNGFTISNVSGDPGTDVMGYLALKITNGDAWAGVVDSPTSTGDQSVTAPGFQPNFVFQFPTMLTGVSTSWVQSAKSGALGMSHFTPDNEYCFALRNDVGAGTTSNDSLVEARALTLMDDTGADAFNADFVSMDSGGWTLNYTTADGTVRKFLAIALSDASGTSGTTLSVNEITHSHSLDAPSLTQQHNLSVDALSHAHSLDSVTLQTATQLAVDSIVHAHSLGDVSLTQTHNLNLENVQHAHSLEAVELSTALILAVESLTHGHSTDGVGVLSQVHVLGVDNLGHTHDLQETVLSQSHSLSVQGLQHEHNLSQVIFVTTKGRMTISFDAKAPTISFDAKAPSIKFQ